VADERLRGGGEIALFSIDGGNDHTGSKHKFDGGVRILVCGRRPPNRPSHQPRGRIPTMGEPRNTLESTWGVPDPTRRPFLIRPHTGFNAVLPIPCAWDFIPTRQTSEINPAYMAQVKQVFTEYRPTGMYVVINDHWDGGCLEKTLGQREPHH